MLLNCNLFFLFCWPFKLLNHNDTIHDLLRLYDVQKCQSKTVQLKQEDSRARTMLISFDNVQPIATLVAH